ncbi:MAG TPA: DUF87 domain-containing protein [Tepidisphaeraceae bacterium]|nr:DUF87 domain-containing protein [Tepidisphaeraceae bacterium]
MQDFEKLGVFYLGRRYDLAAGKGQEDLLLYDSKDLVTHAVCVGMTGSGKTGLCLSLLEEAAIDGIPAIVIDPKGDLGNLLLTFPQLRPEDFAPWINEDDARRKGISPAQFAQQEAQTWTKGLASWGQDGARIQKLRDAADFQIYTPGSTAGIPISILRSFAVPAQSTLDDAELLQEQIRTTVTGLLGLVGVEADPMISREHILLSNIMATSWKQRRDLDLAGLIEAIQKPPLERVGVMDLESFFSQKDRFALAMRLNNLLAAPGFENWLNGEPLDISRILYTPQGKPRIAIFSIAHLSDAERMFFVSMLLNQIVGWTRQQSGTTSLRAIVYMDEIFGYFPPVQNPPSKEPLMLLLKQARAFGVGVVLATQNPVDLDYKGLANCGTWFIGRLQTERDKMRLLDGLESAAASASSNFDRDKMQQVLSSLGNRVFLMNNVHDDGPVVFESRWALSYLRGPLTRQQIKQLMDSRKSSAPAVPAATAPKPQTAAPVVQNTALPADASNARPLLPPTLPQQFIPIRSATPDDAKLLYQPMVVGTAEVFFNDSKSGVMVSIAKCLAAGFVDGPVPIDWAHATELDLAETDFEQAPGDNPAFASVPPLGTQAKSYATWQKMFSDSLFRTVTLEIFKSSAMKQVSKPDETEQQFRVRLSQLFREKRDFEKNRLQQKFAPKLAALDERLRRAQQQVQAQQQQASSAKISTAISFGATVLGALFGRKTISAAAVNRAGSAMRGVSRSMKESGDVSRAEETVGAVQKQIDDLNQQLQDELNDVTMQYDPQSEELESITLRPKKTDVKVRAVVLGWAPHWQTQAGTTPAW